jgi:hypothetical protein
MSAPRRYRGLQLVSEDTPRQTPRPLNRLAQTQAIVAQVEREVAMRAARAPQGRPLILLSPLGARIAIASSGRVGLPLFPARV